MAYDLTGQKFGRLQVIRKSDENIQKKSDFIMWYCKCDCGNYKDVRSQDLRNGKTQSCGCLHKEIISTHGLSRGKLDRLYQIWVDMRSRCNNSKLKCYHNYGGRGIKVCNEWNNYKNFYEWSMDNGYDENLTIDRINVDGNYEPSNCKWSTKLEQENNKRNNRYGLYQGKRMSVSDFIRITNISRSFVITQLNNGKSFDAIKDEYEKKFLNCRIPSPHSSIAIADFLQDRHSDVLCKLRNLIKNDESLKRFIIKCKYITACNNVTNYFEINEQIFDDILNKLKERKRV